MQSLIPAQIGLLAEGFVDLIGPLLIFGIYIIASIIKAAAKKNQGEATDEESESALKKAVRQRYQEIYERQVGKAPQKPQNRPKPPQYVPDRPATRKTEPAAVQQRSQWELRQEAIRRQRNAGIQHPRPPVEYSKPAILNRIAASAIAKPARPKRKPVSAQAVRAETSKKHIQKPAKSVKDRQIQTAGMPLHALTKDPENLRTAFILKEILDKPVALREL